MLDVEKQRKFIFDKYESQCAYSVDITLNKLTGLLDSEKTPTKGILTSYANNVNYVLVFVMFVYIIKKTI